ncbi:MAG: ATP-binding protein [Chloroflexi bacterium]|nr:ATP-binding protein [Chloroflexota bacterium]
MNDKSDLDAAVGPRRSTAPLGVVMGGSLSQGLNVKLDPRTVLEGLAVGCYVVIEGATGRRFFGMITDLLLDSTSPDLPRNPPEDDFAREVYRGSAAFGVMHVAPMLMLDEHAQQPRPIKTIPSHFSPVLEASEADVNLVFGAEDAQHFHIGDPLEMEGVKVNLDLGRFVERSSGVFGKSGTGKSFVTRMILAGVVRSGVASTLIFDMHNDYGWAVKDESGHEYKGLRQIFPDGRVKVFTLDPVTSQHRGSKTDGVLRIGLQQIEPEDVEMLSGVLGLSETQTNALSYLRRKLGSGWIETLLEEDGAPELDAMEEGGKIVAGTLRAIQRKFELFRPERTGFLVRGRTEDAVDRIFGELASGSHVVLEFGNYGNSLASYILVANYLTRRIHARYVDRKNRAAGRQADDPKPLMIVIEEAHKFLDPAVAGHTIFGNIARELRKYNVTLLIVDQRPSGIDDEVMSQIGTRVTCLLDNEADIRAVFSGVSGGSALREVLARLDTRQQALILGHAVPMPVVIRTRDYDAKFYEALGYVEGEALAQKARRASAALFGSE